MLLAAVVGVAFGEPRLAHAAPGGAGGDVVCEPRGEPRAGVVVLRPGSFVVGATAERLRELCRPWADAGFLAVGVDYPVDDFAGAVHASRKAARRLARRLPEGAVFAHGESAGGTLAALLGVTGRVDGATTVGAPMNLLTWAADNRAYWRRLGMTRTERRTGSPVFSISRPSRIFVLHSPADEMVPYSQALELARRLPRKATVHRLTGKHLEDPTATPRAIRLLERKLHAQRT